MKPLDILIVAAAIAVVAWVSVSVYAAKSGAPVAVITGQGGEWVYPLAGDRTLNIAGPLGDTVVRISGKKVFVEDSPCRNKVCIAMGAISRAGQWVACLPNRVFVRVEGKTEDGGVDATVF